MRNSNSLEYSCLNGGGGNSQKLKVYGGMGGCVCLSRQVTARQGKARQGKEEKRAK